MSKPMNGPKGPMGKPGEGPMMGPNGKPMKGGMPKRPGIDMKILSRLMKQLFKFFPVLVPATIVCIIIASVASALPAIFQQQVLAHIGEWY